MRRRTGGGSGWRALRSRTSRSVRAQSRSSVFQLMRPWSSYKEAGQRNAAGLARLGHEVHVFTASPPHQPPGVVIEDGVTVHRLPALFRLGNAPRLPALWRLHSVDQEEENDEVEDHVDHGGHVHLGAVGTAAFVDADHEKRLLPDY